MPRLLLFAPCERAIIGQEDNSFSLISVITGFQANIQFPPEQPLPEKASVPMRWYFAALWACDPGELNGSFVQRIIVKSEDGKELLAAVSPFKMEKDFLRCIVQIQGFPISKPGTLTASIAVQSDSESSW